VALLNLLRLGRLTGDTGLEEKASMMLQAFSGDTHRSPVAHTYFLCSVGLSIGPSHEIIIVGPQGQRETREMIQAIQRAFIPDRIVLSRPTNDPSKIDALAPFLKSYTALGGKATVYVCRNHSCQRPTGDVREMLDMIES